MADENQIDDPTKGTSNVCTTVDAFDAFQNNSMCEESEFILLSDILPEEKPTSDLPGMLDDFLLGGEEEIVASNNYDQPCNTTTNFNENTSKLGDNSIDDVLQESINKTVEKIKGSLGSIQRKKRGRKPKSQTFEANNNPIATDITSPAPQASLQPGKKRGRKSKNSLPDPIPPNEVVQTQEDPVIDLPTSKSGRKRIPRKRYVEEMEEDFVPQPSEPKPKRGRKKKVVTEPTPHVKSDDDADDICLSQLKQTMQTSDNQDNETAIISNPPQEENVKVTPILSDFEYNADNVISASPNVIVASVDPDADLKMHVIESNSVGSLLESAPQVNEMADNENSLLVEDTNKRPTRRKARQSRKYDVDSEEEDPYANVELSDNDKPKGRKAKYYSDDEYVPDEDVELELKENADTMTDDEISDASESWAPKRKRSSSHKSPTKPKRSKKNVPKLEVMTITPNTDEIVTDNIDDIEQCLQSSVIKGGNKTAIQPELPLNGSMEIKSFSTNTAFENFLAKRQVGNELKIKKVTAANTESTIAPLEIPVINPHEKPKLEEKECQTSKIETRNASVQTGLKNEVKIASNVQLDAEQSDSACKFLTSILGSTSELGKLMTQKSDEFMQKKVNTAQVKDTTKIDYCIKKAFLLFKLAKDNLTAMEENLGEQYRDFMNKNKLSTSIEPEKTITPKEKDSDSDCEIIDEPAKPAPKATASTSQNKLINLKTVCLNKELSIKIAKKTNQPETKPKLKPKVPLTIKNSHSVWLNNSVMVKKVKPTQSFLAQDSRNKKPPDSNKKYVTEEMVSKFFLDYYHEQVLAVCAPYISLHWSPMETRQEIACHYFVLDKAETSKSATLSNNVICPPENGDDDEVNKENLPSLKHDSMDTHSENDNLSKYSPKSLYSLCFQIVAKHVEPLKNIAKPLNGFHRSYGNADKLANICLKAVSQIMSKSHENNYEKEMKISSECGEEFDHVNEIVNYDVPTLKTLTFNKVVDIFMNDETESVEDYDLWNPYQEYFDSHSEEVNYDFTVHSERNFNVSSLQDIAFDKIRCLIYGDEFKMPSLTNITSMNSCDEGVRKKTSYNVDSLSNIVLSYLNCDIVQPKTTDGLSIQTVNTLSDEVFNNLGHFTHDENHDTHYDDEYYSEETDDNVIQEVVQEKLKPNVNSLSKIILTYLNMKWNLEPVQSTNSLTIQTINTLSDELFNNLEESNHQDNNDDDDYDDDHYYEEAIHDNHTSETNWTSQIQLEAGPKEKSPLPEMHNVMITNIKREIIDDELEQFPQTFIKSEPIDPCLDFNLGLSVVTKTESSNYPEDNDDRSAPIQRSDSHSYDVDSFETFVRSNKMIQAASAYDDDENNTFSQSSHRVRRQHAPDSGDENDYDMSLLVPQQVELAAKGVLMESSSDEASKGKATDKRAKKRGRAKKQPVDKKTNKNDPQPQTANKNIPKEQNIGDIAILTRRMKERIRAEEQKHVSSESEAELPIVNKTAEDDSTKEILTRSRKGKTKVDKKEENSKKKPSQEEPTQVDTNKSKTEKGKEAAIQCNNVDSTENLPKDKHNDSADDIFTGFGEEDQSDINVYKDVYNKLLAEDDVQNNAHYDEDYRYSPPLITDEPAQELECQPDINKDTQRKKRTPKQPEDKKDSKTINYVDKNGWHCYPIIGSDTKLYQLPFISLEKLPETFVETYFRYQEVTEISKEDAEIDRLINTQSLHRSTNVKGKMRGPMCKIKERAAKKLLDGEPPSPVPTDHYHELTASEDEANPEDETPPLVTERSTENCLAKNSLMDENVSDTDSAEDSKPLHLLERRTKKGAKVVEHPKDLVLTADKMMKKELETLHAPVNLDDAEDVKPRLPLDSKASVPALKERSGLRSHKKREHKTVDDSSSEEEKQWVNTKSKLLKRMEKKIQEDASVDDAKRAKLVSEYIVKRGECVATATMRKRGAKRRSTKKFMEQQKQMRALSKQLSGDIHFGKKNVSSYGKGRRNIRKVIDKKSLQRSTVVANITELDRKRRINAKSKQLRELLGCEEGVNVLVINNKVCLEYDFSIGQPVVTVHNYFTDVMKTHQYEGVKFMWDACFESLEMIRSGSEGGGCILAHCMGLGKTLQVLALLHTVLTHPGVNMQRVLVCCPLSTVLNWVDEIHKWLRPVTDQIKVFELSKLKKTYERAYQLEDWYTNGGIFIIGYELFRSLSTLDPEFDDIRPNIMNKIHTALLDPGPDIIVCDEGHLLKNDSSVLAVSMNRVKTKRRIVLTGTPMQNNLREYFCMVNFVKPSLLGTYAEYSNRFENPIMNGQHRDSREEDIKLMKARTHILHKVLEGCLQRQEASVLYPYLPKKHEYTVFISLTDCQAQLYQHYLDNYTGANKKISLLKDFHMLQKVWTHPQVLHHFNSRAKVEGALKVIKDEKLEDDLAREDLAAAAEDVKPTDGETWWLQHLDGGTQLESLDASNKFVVVFKIIDQCVKLGDKLLIFSTSLYTLDALEFFLKKIKHWSLGQDYYRLDGSVPPEVRQKWCREFNAENNRKTKLFLVSTRAGCLGLNMTAANRVIILDTSWNPAHDIQSIFRVYRFGQKKDCYIYRLVAMGTMEQKIYERSVTKQAVACRVVDEQQIDRHYNMADLTELYKFSVGGSGMSRGVAADVRDVCLLRVARDTPALHAVHEHDSLLRDTREDLPEHERRAAWLQFQQEHDVTKNVFPGAYGNVLAQKRPFDHEYSEHEEPQTSSLLPTTSSLLQTFSKKYEKSGNKKKKCKKSEDTEPTPTTSDDPTPISVNTPPILNFTTGDQSIPADVMSKISEALSSHKFNKTDGSIDAAEVAKVISRYLANVEVDDGQEATQNESETAPPEPQNTEETQEISPPKKKGRPKKKKPGRPRKAVEPTSMSDSNYLDKMTKNIVNTSNSDTNVIEDNSKNEKPADVKAETALEDDSVVLSDDEEIVPLHNSLLSNKNFVKIVAHTYLKGNPMLDEDSATLAAEYSTSKALREAEMTGKMLCSGPIYEIAMKVLGVDVLKKLLANDAEKQKEDPVKTYQKQTPKITLRSKTNMTSQITTQLRGTKMEISVTSRQANSTVQAQTSIPKIYLKKSNVLPESGTQANYTLSSGPSTSVTTPVSMYSAVSRNEAVPPSPVGPVVPVGPIRIANNMAMTVPSIQPAVESILPDDDDDICIIDQPRPAPTITEQKKMAINPPKLLMRAPAPRPIAPKIVLAASNQQPIILNTFLSGGRPQLIRLGTVKQTPQGLAKIPSPDAYILKKVPHTSIFRTMTVPPKPSTSATATVTSAAPAPAPSPAATPAASPAAPQTICLDSDEEEPPAPVKPTPKPRTVPSAKTSNIKPANAKKQVIEKKKPPTKPPAVESSSDDSRPTSPDDPLSVLKNVVHIQAPGASTPTSAVAKKRTTIAPPKTKTPNKVPPTTESPKQQVSVLKNVLDTIRGSMMTKIRNKPIEKPVKIAPAPEKPVRNVLGSKIPTKAPEKKILSERVPSKVIEKNNKEPPKLRLLGTFDLTESKPANKVDSKNTASTSFSKIDLTGTVITSKAKDIIIKPVSKTAKKAPATVTSNESKSNTRILHVQSKHDNEMKRKVETTASKAGPPQPKKAKPTRLEDFSIDDIEDIIELE